MRQGHGEEFRQLTGRRCEIRNKPVHILVTGAQVRIVTEEGELLRALTIDPTRDYQPLNGRWPVHNVLRQASAMS
jgi:hypothetical protein